MKQRPAREDYRRWLNAQRGEATADAQASTQETAALPEIPETLPYAGYVVWFYASLTYLDIRFDHHQFAIVTQQVPCPAEAFYFDHFDAAYGHAADVGEPCLILFASVTGGAATVAG
ncbi:hypothetical protein PAQ31011_03733 [Pandoraea aquatica]|uniref:Uncharacterized protein n=1 Tax=Pandoraea aquatica TaxID=2508290 RepID=A0A5E4X820_9BURK|nr:hypothetical protein [Pandoraea aquatica]VVE32295.1 hypothetical protein PAQ31011_03733 [Pandoraea aquatica]